MRVYCALLAPSAVYIETGYGAIAQTTELQILGVRVRDMRL